MTISVIENAGVRVRAFHSQQEIPQQLWQTLILVTGRRLHDIFNLMAAPGSRPGAAIKWGRYSMSTILIIILVIVLLGGGGGYYGYRSYGGRGLGGVLGLVLIVLIVLWLAGGLGGMR
jgi:hypothetical protein